MIKTIAAAVLLLAAGAANAANYQGFITNVTPVNGRLFISIGGGGFDGGTPSTCYTSSTSMIYSIDVSTANGKAVLATALSAKLTGRQVYVYGDGTCPAGGNAYDGKGSEAMAGIDLKG